MEASIVGFVMEKEIRPKGMCEYPKNWRRKSNVVVQEVPQPPSQADLLYARTREVLGKPLRQAEHK